MLSVYYLGKPLIAEAKEKEFISDVVIRPTIRLRVPVVLKCAKNKILFERSEFILFSIKNVTGEEESSD